MSPVSLEEFRSRLAHNRQRILLDPTLENPELGSISVGDTAEGNYIPSTPIKFLITYAYHSFSPALEDSISSSTYKSSNGIQDHYEAHAIWDGLEFSEEDLTGLDQDIDPVTEDLSGMSEETTASLSETQVTVSG